MAIKDKGTKEKVCRATEEAVNERTCHYCPDVATTIRLRCCGVLAPCDIPSEGRVVIGAWTHVTSAQNQHVVELQTDGTVRHP